MRCARAGHCHIATVREMHVQIPSHRNPLCAILFDGWSVWVFLPSACCSSECFHFSDSCKLFNSEAIYSEAFLSIQILVCIFLAGKKLRLIPLQIYKTSLVIIAQKIFFFTGFILKLNKTLWSQFVSCACGRHEARAACWRFDKSPLGSEFEKCTGKFERAAGFGAHASEMLLSRMHKVAQFIWDAPFNSIDRHTRNRLHAPLSPRASAIHMGFSLARSHPRSQNLLASSGAAWKGEKYYFMSYAQLHDEIFI